MLVRSGGSLRIGSVLVTVPKTLFLPPPLSSIPVAALFSYSSFPVRRQAQGAHPGSRPVRGRRSVHGGRTLASLLAVGAPHFWARHWAGE